MPELPEVETVMRGMAPMMEGAKITFAEAYRADLRQPIPADLSARMTGNVCKHLSRRNKYILMHFSDGLVAIIHLGMSGRITLHEKIRDMPGSLALPGLLKHDHIVWETDRGRIVFNDPRRFGLMLFSDEDSIDQHPLLKDLGPEPHSNRFDERYLLAALSGRRSPIKSALLDQKVIAGLGNIYVCESLWRSGISPRRLATNVGAARISKLVPAIRTVISEAIAAGGSTLKDYAKVDGELGYFQHQFSVYDQEGKLCKRDECGGSIQRIVQSGRSSFFCPTCQR